MIEKAKEQEIPPVLIGAVVVVAVVIFVFVVWFSGRPEGVKTAKPPAPNPPGGRILVQ
jgi:hypothetical protein